MQFTRLISPVILAVLASLLALTLVAMFFTNQLDANSLEAEKRLLSRSIANVPKNLAALAEDNSWWDEAVEKMYLTEDLIWMAETMGGTVDGIGEIEGGIVLRPDNSILYKTNRLGQPADLAGLLRNGLASAISELQPVNLDVGVSTYGYATSEGRVFALGISMVQPSGFKVFDPPLELVRRPVLVFYREVNQTQIREFTQTTELVGLRFSATHQPPTNKDANAFIALTGLNGMPIGHFEWTPARPGAILLEQLLWPAVFLLCLILMAGLSFVRRAQKLVDGLAKADQAKMAFLASMSHEVRTPLNAIIGFTEILRMDADRKLDDEKHAEYLNIIHSSGEHLLTVINDILNISKLDAGKMEVFAAKMDPTSVVKEAIRMVENNAKSRSIRLFTELESAEIFSDERIIRQILINLLSNAVKFTEPDGQVSVMSEKTTNTYIITVSDTGIGMSQDEINVALAPFGQIHNNRQNTSVGTGLGLPLVKRFITLIGGNMTIRSAPGHGTSIKLELPIAAPKKAGNKTAAQELLY